MQVQTDSSFAYFFSPFSFNSEKFKELVASVETATCASKEGRVALWEGAEDELPHADILRHVQEFLGPRAESPTARVWRLTDLASENLELRSSAHWELQMMIHGAVRSLPIRFRDLSDHFPGEARSQVLRLALFQTGVGFLILAGCPALPSGDVSPSLSEWYDFIHFFRFTGYQRDVLLRPPGDPHQYLSHLRGLWPTLPAREEHGRGLCSLQECLEALLRRSAVSSDGDTQWWQDIFAHAQLLPYTGVYVSSRLPTEIGKSCVEPADLVCYRLRHFFAADKVLHPAPEDLDRCNQEIWLYGEGQYFFFSLEGGGFLAYDPPNEKFFRWNLPSHLRREYFFLLLLSMAQRFSLIRLSIEVAKCWDLPETRRIAHLNVVRTGLHAFTSRLLFTQVTNSQHHHTFYRKWQDTFQIAALSQEVSDEIRELHDYLTTRQNERFQRNVSKWAMAFIFPSVICAFLGVNINGWTVNSNGLDLHPHITFIGSIIVLWIAGVLWWLRER
jgi:hypothetical protein